MLLKNVVFILIFILAAAALFFAIETGENGVACTMEAKICPDGTAVGRVGPKCEFAPCPGEIKKEVELETRAGKTVSALDVSITPIEVIEDSRCPVDVVCIQAGTVRLRARLLSGLGEANQVFEIGKPITTEVEEITLLSVLPEPRAGKTILPADYVFKFSVRKR